MQSQSLRSAGMIGLTYVPSPWSPQVPAAGPATAVPGGRPGSTSAPVPAAASRPNCRLVKSTVLSSASDRRLAPTLVRAAGAGPLDQLGPAGSGGRGHVEALAAGTVDQ